LGSVMQNRTVEGLLAYCDWLIDKGYASIAQVDPWRTATRKVFETVEGEDYVSFDLSGIDLADYLSRFQTLAGSQYKAESIVTYGRRVRNAMDAHEHYLNTGKAPTFRRGDSSPAKASETKPRPATAAPAALPPGEAPSSGPSVVEFPFPLRGGQIAQLRLPTRLDKSDVDRLSAFLRTLQAEEQPQLPRRAGDTEALAA
jgi:hypothetical protein